MGHLMQRYLLLVVLALSLPTFAQGNSTKKVRHEPSEQAERAGSAINWRTDLEAALSESKTSGKAVFWYVPDVHKSFVDRGPEVDRKMRSGPFSWPRFIELLNEHYVPVKAIASKELGERYDVRRDHFLPPGIVLLQDGAVTASFDELSTHHPAWYHARFEAPLGLEREWRSARITATETPDAAESLYLAGVDAGDVQRVGAWRRLMKEHPDHPLAFKVAMELEGHGPLLRGQEVYGELPEAALAFSGRGTRAPLGAYSEEELWLRSVRFLVDVQSTSGAYRDSIYDFGGTDSLRHVFGAVTSLAMIALTEGSSRVKHPELPDARDAARRFALEVATNPDADLDERIWAQMYCLRALLETDPSDADGQAQALVELLLAEQLESGAWRHEYPSNFVTADVLIALAFAKRHGLEIPDEAKVVEPALAAILRCRAPDGGYSYYLTREGRKPRASIQGSVGRAPRCELALALWGSPEARDLETTVALSFEHEGPLLEIQKLDDHGPKFAYGGFFFWWDLHARTEAICALPAGKARTEFARRQREQIVGLAEIDGCFVDSHEVGRAYGTSMALWCLAQLDRLP